MIKITPPNVRFQHFLLADFYATKIFYLFYWLFCGIDFLNIFVFSLIVAEIGASTVENMLSKHDSKIDID